MKYRIDYSDGRNCDFSGSRNDLLKRLSRLKREMVQDIRKLYKSGVSDSVLEKYEFSFGR